MLVIFNNDYNSHLEVMSALMEATECSVEEAAIEMWEAETFGKAPVHFAEREACERAARVLHRIGLVTEVTPEWLD